MHCDLSFENPLLEITLQLTIDFFSFLIVIIFFFLPKILIARRTKIHKSFQKIKFQNIIVTRHKTINRHRSQKDLI